MRLPTYLVLSSSGIFHFRFIVPMAWRVAIGRRVIKQTLRTRSRRRAQLIALILAERYSHIFGREDIDMADLNLDEATVAAGQAESKQYEITLGRGGRVESLKTDDAADHARAMVAIKAMNSSGAGAAPSIGVKSYKSITLGKAVAEWCLKIKPSDPNQKTKLKTFGTKKLAVEGFRNWKGEKTIVYNLTEEDFAKFTVYLTHEGGAKNYNIAESTVSNRLVYCTQFMRWAQKLKYYPRGENPAAGHAPYGNKAKKARTRKTGWQPFTDEQIQMIFKPENFKLSSEKPHTRWGIIMALYTGARISEIAQLGLQDFKKKGVVNYIAIDTLEDGQSVKNEDSRREIPIHPDLVKLGLMDRVETLKSKGENMLFPELTAGQNGFGGAVSKGITRYLNQLGITARGSGRVGAHSFRSTMIKHLAAKDISDEDSRKFVGHTLASGDSHRDYEEKGEIPKRSQIVSGEGQIIKALPSPGWSIDLPGLKPLLAKI